MVILVGTDDGLYKDTLEPGREPIQVLEGVAVRQIHQSTVRTAVYSATSAGVYRSTDGGESWTNIGLSDQEIASVVETPDGNVLLAGTQPAHLYQSTDGGDTWELCSSFEQLPGKEAWEQLGPGGPQVRDMAVHPRAPSKLFVAIEAEGVYLSPDSGDTWEFRSFGLHCDPHHIHTFEQDSLIAACGRGLYRTIDAGRHWHRLDTHRDLFWHTYYREALTHRGVLYSSAQDRSEERHAAPGSGRIVTSHNQGSSLAVDAEFPGAGGDFINAWTAHGSGVVGGTIGGRLLVGPNPWKQRSRVNGEISSLTTIQEDSPAD